MTMMALSQSGRLMPEVGEDAELMTLTTDIGFSRSSPLV
jgi:hypothetical protein